MLKKRVKNVNYKICIKKYIVVNIMSEHMCDRCGRMFSQKYNYMRHLNRKIKCEKKECERNDYGVHCDKTLNNDKLIECLKNKCILKQDDNKDMKILLESLLKIEEENMQLKNEMMEMKVSNNTEKKHNTKNSRNHNTNTHSKNKTTTNSNNNNNTNNIIQVVAYGKEDINGLTDAEYKDILKRGFRSVQELLKKLHFNKNHPENHNIYISNLRDDLVKQYNGEKWESKNRPDALQEIYDDKLHILDDKFDDLIEELDDTTKRRYQKFSDKQGDDEKIIKRIKTDLKGILYEYKDTIKKSQKT